MSAGSCMAVSVQVSRHEVTARRQPALVHVAPSRCLCGSAAMDERLHVMDAPKQRPLRRDYFSRQCYGNEPLEDSLKKTLDEATVINKQHILLLERVRRLQAAPPIRLAYQCSGLGTVKAVTLLLSMRDMLSTCCARALASEAQQ